MYNKHLENIWKWMERMKKKEKWKRRRRKKKNKANGQRCQLWL